MNKFFERIGNAITSMAAIIFVLVMTIIAMIFFSHTLFYETFPLEMTTWEKSTATWALACAWELTVLITTVNTQFISKKIPFAMAVCSGVIIMMFIHGFDEGLSPLEYFKRWFIGILVATINIVFAELFYKKWKENVQTKEVTVQLKTLETDYQKRTTELSQAKTELSNSKALIEQLTDKVKELELFREQELQKLTCSNCKQTFESVYKLASHKAQCGK